MVFDRKRYGIYSWMPYDDDGAAAAAGGDDDDDDVGRHATP